MSTTQSAIARACEVVGGQATLAGHLDVTPATVSQWCNGVRPIPAERCPQIEKITRERGATVRCEELRPDVAWDVLREQAGEPTAAAAPWDGTERRANPRT